MNYTTNYSFGTWVKRRRKALDLTQDMLAQRVGCSPSLIFKIETDERRPSRQMAEILAARLEIPADQTELFLKVARQDRAADNLDAIAPPEVPAPLKEADRPASNLPLSPTTFIGREHEMNILVSQLTEPACRLLTLLGPGGIGKTRLAVEVGRRLQNVFPDGIFFINLATVSDPDSLLPALADGLGITFSGPAEPHIQLSQHLKAKQILLILDNMEHLVANASFLAEILHQAPQVKILVTSREQLQLQWEWLFEVQGLPVPEDPQITVLESNTAVTLFLQRARQVSPHYQFNEPDLAAVARICKSVDGIPLALELAASWVRLMTVQEIADELERSLDLLETSLQDVPARHRSMKAVFDHSWSLLAEEDRQLLMKLSLFAGSFTRKAAQAVTTVSLSQLSSFVSKSLIHFDQNSDRYNFHEMVRQYARSLLDQRPKLMHQIYEQYSRYYSNWLSELECPLKSPQQIEVSARIRLETPNWTSAWRWCVDQHRLDLLRLMIPCLSWYHEVNGYYADALALYQVTVDQVLATGDPRLFPPDEKATTAFLLDNLAWNESRIGNLEKARRLLAESLELAIEVADQEVLYFIYGNWGYIALQNGNPEDAERLTLKSLESARILASEWHIAIPINVLGIIEFQRGNLHQAQQQLSACLPLWRTVGDPRGMVFCLLYLGMTNFALGDLDSARSVLLESNAIAQRKKDHWAHAFGLDLLGQIAVAKEEFDSAQKLFEQSLYSSREIGDQWAATQTLIHLGQVQARFGFTRQTREVFLQAYQNAEHARWTPTLIEVLLRYVGADPNLDAAVKLEIVQAVQAHPAANPVTMNNAQELYKSLRSDGGMTRFNQPKQPEKSAEAWAQEIFTHLAEQLDQPSR